MKLFALLILTFTCLACGGMLPGKLAIREPASVPAPAMKTSDQGRELTHLQVLHKKLLRENKTLSLAIVNGMLAELKEKNPALSDPETLPDLKELRKNPAFVSLELTVEHLSHRESVKNGPRHSAFHNAQP